MKYSFFLEAFKKFPLILQRFNKIELSDFKTIFVQKPVCLLKTYIKKNRKFFQNHYFYHNENFFFEKMPKIKSLKLNKKATPKNLLKTSKRRLKLNIFQKPNPTYFFKKFKGIFLSLLRQRQLKFEYHTETFFISSFNDGLLESKAVENSKIFESHSKRFLKSSYDSNFNSLKIGLKKQVNVFQIFPKRFKTFSKSVSSVILKEKIYLSCFQFLPNFQHSEKVENKNFQKFMPDVTFLDFWIPSYLFEFQKKMAKTKCYKVEKIGKNTLKYLKGCQSFKIYFFGKFFQIFIYFVLANFTSNSKFLNAQNRHLLSLLTVKKDEFKEKKFVLAFLKEVYNKFYCFYRENFIVFPKKFLLAQKISNKENYLQNQDFPGLNQNIFLGFSKNFNINSSSIIVMRLEFTLKNFQNEPYENGNKLFNRKLFSIFFLSILNYLKFDPQKFQRFRPSEFPFFRCLHFSSFWNVFMEKNSQNFWKSKVLKPFPPACSLFLHFLQIKLLDFEKNFLKKLFLNHFQKIQNKNFQFESSKTLVQNMYHKEKLKNYLLIPKGNPMIFHQKPLSINFYRISDFSFLTLCKTMSSLIQNQCVFSVQGLFDFYGLFFRKAFLSPSKFLFSKKETWLIFYQKSFSKIFLFKFIQKWYIWQSLYEGNFFNIEASFQEIFFLTQNFQQKIFFFKNLKNFSRLSFQNFHLTNLYRFLNPFGFRYHHSLIILKSSQSFLVFPDELNVFEYFHYFQKKLKKSATKSQDSILKEMSPFIYAWCYANKSISSELWLKVCDFKIFEFLWQWACRRHNNKSKQWIRKKYFSSWHSKIWIFACYLENESCLQLFQVYFPLLLYLPFHTQILRKIQTRKIGPS